MTYNKIGFLTGVGGNANGIGEYVRACHASGHPSVIFVNNATTGISDILALDDSIDHIMAYRVVKDGSEQYAVPNYSLTPKAAAIEYKNRIEPEISPEVRDNRSRIWILVGNELDKNRSSWLGEWALESSYIWNADGYKIAPFGFSGGEPETYNWAEMKAFLEHAAKNKNKIAINLHEYSYTQDILTGYPWMVGRFQFLFQYCDDAGIGRPNVLIGEWGWEKDFAPSSSVAIQHIANVANMYAQFDEVLGAGIWTLQGWTKPIYNDIQKMIAPVTGLSISFVQGEFSEMLIIDPSAPTGPIHEGYHQAVLLKSPQLFKYVGGDGYTQLEYINVATWAYNNYGRSLITSTDDAIGLARLGNDESFIIVVDPNRSSQQDAIIQIEESGYKYTTMYINDPESVSPIEGLKLGYLFKVPYVYTSFFNAARNYGKHEGIDADIENFVGNSFEPVIATYDGVVERSLDSSGGYGKYVRVKHTRNGGIFYTRYAHLDKRYVEVGQFVRRGDSLGEIGTTGNVTGEHVHFNLEVPGYGLDGYVVADVVNPHPYLPDPATLPPPVRDSIDVGSFQLANPMAFRVIKSFDGTTTHQEDVQDMILAQSGSTTQWVRRKNNNAEWWNKNGKYSYLVHDTSPANDSQGNQRVYTLYQVGIPGARKNPTMMQLGQSWIDPLHHTVQFRATDGCGNLSENSGEATNVCELVAYRKNHTFNIYGQNLTIDEVIWLNTGVEMQVYGKHNGSSIGWIGWNAPWGNAEITELHFNRAPMTQEPDKRCPF